MISNLCLKICIFQTNPTQSFLVHIPLGNSPPCIESEHFLNTHCRKQKDHKHLPVISKVKEKNRPNFMKLAIGHKTPTLIPSKKV